MLYEIDLFNLRSESVKSYSVTIHIKATAQGVLTASFGDFLKCINFLLKLNSGSPFESSRAKSTHMTQKKKNSDMASLSH